MKTPMNLLAVILALCVGLVSARAQGTAFTYQGRLTDAGSAANGNYDLRFTIYDSATNGTVIAGPITNSPTSLNNGLFNVTLDFGASVFDGNPRWLEIAVQTNGGVSFSPLSPRQPLTPTPYALFTPSAATATTASNLVSGAVSATQLNTPGTPASGQVLSYNGASLVWTNAAAAGAAWSLNGNAGTTSGVSFLGTTDNQPLELWVNKTRAFRLEPKTNGGPNVIGGSSDNLIETDGVVSGTIGGGDHNSIQYGAWNSTIGGGCCNTIQNSTSYSFIGGGSGNVIQTQAIYSVIGGGFDNTIRRKAEYSTISGGFGNIIQADAPHSTIGGGIANQIQDNADESTIGGGHGNWIETNSVRSTIGGGLGNVLVNAPWGTIAGGVNNIILNAGACSVGGGIGNTIEGRTSYSTIGGGIANAIHTNADYATIGGGDSNTCNGSHATIPGGLLNSASGGFSLAAGSRAKANYDGTFVWADSTGADFSSTATNEFAVRATGGVRLVSGVDSNGVPVAGVSLPAGSGSWATLSDRNAKENFAAADTRKILERVAALPIQTWNYKTQDRTVRHLGPVAQDFHAAFGVGEDDRRIATVDEGGVALAAIQGLNEKLETQLRAKEAEIQQIKGKVGELDELRQRLATLESLLKPPPLRSHERN